MKLSDIKIVCLLFLLSMLLSLGACKSRKIRPKADNIALEKSNAEKLLAVKQAQADFNTLAIKAKAELSLDGNSNEVTINFRMLKGQKMWISVTAIAGLEVARILITPDSIKIINRLESTYIAKPFSFIHQFTNGQINLAVLESIIVGNVFADALSSKPTFTTENNMLQLSGKSAAIAYRLKFNDAFKLTQTALEDSLASQQLLATYNDFFMEAGLMVAHQVKIQSAAGNKSILAELKFTKLEKDVALDFPFSVPKRFSVKN